MPSSAVNAGSGPRSSRMPASTPGELSAICCTIETEAGRSLGNCPTSALSASTPPMDDPITTTSRVCMSRPAKESLERCECRAVPFYFHHHSSLRRFAPPVGVPRISIFSACWRSPTPVPAAARLLGVVTLGVILSNAKRDEFVDHSLHPLRIPRTRHDLARLPTLLDSDDQFL